ncbi:MAG: aminotransferase class I/II-fold pyridoxal phosphate-dependent enzyme [Planctomycetota bacterium]
MTQSRRIYLSPPDVGPTEEQAVVAALRSGWVAPVGPEIDHFEQEFASYVGRKHAVAVSSGTAALHLALAGIGVGPGDTVITATATFVATVNAIRYVGATPVFVDSESQSWNMSAELLDEELAERFDKGQNVAAVIAVDLYGQAADYAAIESVCEKYQVQLIEDGAEGLGATRDGRPVGSFGYVSCFSFNGNKVMTTSGGGMVVTDDAGLAKRIRYLATQARQPQRHYEHIEVGYNYRMSNILAALGRAQLSRLDQMIATRRSHFQRYCDALGDHLGFDFMPEPAGSCGTRWLICASLNPSLTGLDRDRLIDELEQSNIEARPTWKPMHLQPVNRDFACRGGEVAEEIFRTGICLPSGSSLSTADVDRVIDVIRNALLLCRPTNAIEVFQR